MFKPSFWWWFRNPSEPEGDTTRGWLAGPEQLEHHESSREGQQVMAGQASRNGRISPWLTTITTNPLWLAIIKHYQADFNNYKPSLTGWWFGCHLDYFPIYKGLLSSSQMTKSYFSEGWPNQPPSSIGMIQGTDGFKWGVKITCKHGIWMGLRVGKIRAERRLEQMHIYAS